MTGMPRLSLLVATLALLLVGCGTSQPVASPVLATTAPSTVAAGPTQGIVATGAPGVIDSDPGGSPLTLAWQTGGAPESQMQDPIHLGLGPDGNIYVGSATSSGLVRVFDPNGKFVTAWGADGPDAGEFRFLLGLGVDPMGNVYAGDFDGNRINKFTSAGRFLLSWATEQPVGPAGIAVDAQGNVYVVNHRVHGHYVQKFDGSGKLLAEWGSTGSGDGQIGAGASSGPEDLAVDRDGNVYVADRVNDRIEEFDGTGKFIATIGTSGSPGHGQLSSPGDVTVDRQGNIYVLDDGFLQEFDTHGAFAVSWPLDGPLQNAGEVMADATGNLYVNTDVLLEKFSQ